MRIILMILATSLVSIGFLGFLSMMLRRYR